MRTQARTLLAGAIAAALLACSLAGALASTARAQAEWTTYHRDAERSGVDPDATEPMTPVLAWQTPSLGAPIWGQPVVLGSRMYVATVGDELYALNAVTGAVEWQQSAGTPVPSEELPCGDITPTVGIVSTPLIDTSTGMIYVVADTWNEGTGEARHMLESFNLQTGAHGPSVPVDPPGVNPETILQRSALNLDDGQIVFGFGGNFGSCSQEVAPLVAVPVSTVSAGPAGFWQTHSSFGTTAGGVWDTGGVAVDLATDDIYAATANPLPTVAIHQSEYDFSDSVVELSLADFVARPTEEPLTQLGWFEPQSWELRSNNDLDLGSAGPELLPGGMLFEAGKDGAGYLIEEAGMVGGGGERDNEEICDGDGSFGGDSYDKETHTIYIPCTNGVEALAYDETAGTFSSLWHGPSDAFGSPILSGGLVWVLATGGFEGGGTTLYGLNPSSGARVETITLPSPITDHFGSPSAAGGRLFVATGCSVTAYEITQHPEGGLTPAASPTSAQCPPAAQRPAAPGSPNPPAGAPTSPVPTSPVQAPADAAASPQPPAPLLLQTKLHATSAGKLQLRLRCTVTAGSCAGSVTLNARFVVTTGRGSHRTRRTVLIALARASYQHARGDFTVTISLGRGALAHLRAHAGRLALRVAISATGSGGRVVSAVLT